MTEQSRKPDDELGKGQERALEHLVEVIVMASRARHPDERRAVAAQIFAASLPLRALLTRPVGELVTESVDLLMEELQEDFSVRSARAIAWEADYLRKQVSDRLGRPGRAC